MKTRVSWNGTVGSRAGSFTSTPFTVTAASQPCESTHLATSRSGSAGSGGGGGPLGARHRDLNVHHLRPLARLRILRPRTPADRPQDVRHLLGRVRAVLRPLRQEPADQVR